VHGGLDSELFFDGEPIVDLLHKLFNRGALVTASDRFMHVPANTFNGIGFRGVARQKMEHNPISPSLQIFAVSFA
jgi:hypothetical protein